MQADINNTVLTLVDVQEKLCAVMHKREELIQNLVKLVKAMQLLGVPIIRLEQNPEKMGQTIPELAQLFTEPPIQKMSFSCCGSAAYMEALTALNRKHIIIAGIETHICVYQTAADLAEKGYSVEVVANAASSRIPINRDTALTKINSTPGADITTVETIIFELMRSAEHPAFRDILKIIK
jgi:nicotinamidase-related amidase